MFRRRATHVVACLTTRWAAAEAAYDVVATMLSVNCIYQMALTRNRLPRRAAVARRVRPVA